MYYVVWRVECLPRICPSACDLQELSQWEGKRIILGSVSGPVPMHGGTKRNRIPGASAFQVVVDAREGDASQPETETRTGAQMRSS